MSNNSIFQNFPQWEKTKKELEDDIYNIDLWNELISHHEKLINDHKELLKTRMELKKLLLKDIDILVTKFPYYQSYWKRYIAIVDLLEGKNTSIKILERSLISFPQSLDLWVDYLDIIVTNSLKNENEIKDLFIKALKNIGFHFLGHKFWDIYLNWAKTTYGINSNDYMNILLQVIRIPLHQYAKYSDEFNKLCKNFTIYDIIEKDDLIAFINKKKYLSTNLQDDLDVYIDSNSENLIHNYFSEILDEVEIRAQDKWKYESIIKQDFDLNMITIQELNQWISYLKYEEEYHKNTNNDERNLLNLFERALIPTCFSDKIWILYTRYLIQNNGPYNQIEQIFNKACDHFVPLDLKDIRYMYIKFIELKLKKDENCKNIFLSLIKESPTESDPVSKYIQFLINKVESKEDFLKDLVNCVLKFNEDNEDIGHSNKKRKSNKSNVKLMIKNKDIEELFKILTFWNIGELIVSVCKYHWLIEKNIKRTRDILMSVFSTYAIKSNRSYWFFFFKFEICQRNKKNLFNIVESVKTKSTLNISDINLLIEEYNSFVMKNFTVTDLKQNERDIVKNILEIDPESSTHMKHFLKTRLAIDNDEETVNKRLFKENGHPAAICEGVPTLTNPLLVSEFTFKSNCAPPLPHFRNVEKSSLNVKYIRESI